MFSRNQGMQDQCPARPELSEAHGSDEACEAALPAVDELEQWRGHEGGDEGHHHHDGEERLRA